jgi:hypothetical protein
MLSFSQGCLDFDVSGNITTIEPIIWWHFPHNRQSQYIWLCGRMFHKVKLLYLLRKSLITIVVMWISLNKTSMRIIKSIIVLLTPFHKTSVGMVMSRRIGRYQMCNQSPYIEEEQTTQWSKEKVQKTNYDLQNIHIKLKIEEHEPH